MDQEDNERQMQTLAVRWTQAMPAVAAFISSVVRRHHDAEDLLQRTAASLVTLHDKYDPSKPFVGWAIGIARIEVMRYRQERKRERAVFDSETIQVLAGAFERAAGDAAETKAALDLRVRKLRGRLKEIFILHYVQELRPSQIAQQLCLTTQAIFSSLHRGRLALRQCIERRLGRYGGTT